MKFQTSVKKKTFLLVVMLFLMLPSMVTHAGTIIGDMPEILSTDGGKVTGIPNFENQYVFVAEGKALMPFLEEIENYEYSIVSPSRRGEIVTAKAKGTVETIDIRYFVESQKVYYVEILFPAGESTISENYFFCALAFAKTFCPNIDDTTFFSCVEKAINVPDVPIILPDLDMTVEFSWEELSLRITY